MNRQEYRTAYELMRCLRRDPEMSLDAFENVSATALAYAGASFAWRKAAFRGTKSERDPRLVRLQHLSAVVAVFQALARYGRLMQQDQAIAVVSAAPAAIARYHQTIEDVCIGSPYTVDLDALRLHPANYQDWFEQFILSNQTGDNAGSVCVYTLNAHWIDAIRFWATRNARTNSVVFVEYQATEGQPRTLFLNKYGVLRCETGEDASLSCEEAPLTALSEHLDAVYAADLKSLAR